MLPNFARFTVAVALAFAAQASIPGWTPAAMAATAQQKKCTNKSHQHTKVAAAKPPKSAKWVGGGAGAQMRRSPDIQILSYGP